MEIINFDDKDVYIPMIILNVVRLLFLIATTVLFTAHTQTSKTLEI